MNFITTARLNKAVAIAKQRESIANWRIGLAQTETEADRLFVQRAIDNHEAIIARIKSESEIHWN